MPARPFLLVPLALLLVVGAAPLPGQRLSQPRFPAAGAVRVHRAPAAPVATGVAPDSGDSAAGRFIGSVLLGGSGSAVGFFTGLLTAMALHIDGDADPALALAVILPQSALLAGAGGCAPYHEIASCHPIFAASALGAVGGVLLATAFADSRDAAQPLIYVGVHTLAVAIAGVIAREEAVAAKQARQKAAP